MDSVKEIFSRNWRYLLFAVMTFLILWVLYTWRTILLPFMLGLLMAYLFSPIVKFIERILPGKGKWGEAKRVFAIIFILITVLGILAFAVFIAVTAISHNLSDMIKNASQMINNIIARGQAWTQAIRDKFPVGMREQVDAVFNSLGKSLADTLTGSLTSGNTIANRITGSFGIILGFAAVPLFLFYLLKDSEKIQAAIYKELPPVPSKHTRNVVHIIELVLGRYIRAEVLLGFIVGGMSLVGLLIMRAPFAVPLAVFNGICETIPTLGPILGGAVMGLVMLALAPDKVIWAILLAIVVQLLENNLLVPRIQASCLRLHPTLILLLLVLGGYLWGFWGLVLTVPLTATIVEIFKYVRQVNREANQARQPSQVPQPGMKTKS